MTFDFVSDGIPTSVDFVYESSNQFVCSFNTANCVIFDLETGKPVMRLDTEPDQGSNSINRQINRVSAVCLQLISWYLGGLFIQFLVISEY